jgi:hypothetical protein
MTTRLQFYRISFVLKFLLLIAIALFPIYNNSLRKPFHSFEFIVLIILISMFIFIIIKELILDSHYLKYITQNTLLAFAIWELVKFIQFQFGYLPYYSDSPIVLIILFEFIGLIVSLTIIWSIFKGYQWRYRINKKDIH